MSTITVRAAGVSIQGIRRNMEDTCRVVAQDEARELASLQSDTPDDNLTYIGVFDGHGGADAAHFAKDELHSRLFKHASFSSDIGAAFKETFFLADHEFCRTTESTAGTTAIVAVVRGSSVHIANAGDCRCVLYSKDSTGTETVTALSADHRPESSAEIKRVKSAGGTVHGGMVNGILAVSRAIGDPEFKYPESVDASAEFTNDDMASSKAMIVTSEPEVKTHSLHPENDQFVVLGSDGLWDVMSNKDVCAFVENELALDARRPSSADLERIARDLADHAVEECDSVDNVTVGIVTFH